MSSPAKSQAHPCLLVAVCGALMTVAVCGCAGNSAGTAAFSGGDGAVGPVGSNGGGVRDGGGDASAGGAVLPAFMFTEVAPLPGPARENAVAFVIGGRGYVGTGRSLATGVPSFADFWRYDPAAGTWEAAAELPGARSAAVAFAVGDHGYVGTGRRRDDTDLADFWRYDPANNTWTQLADFPVATSGASSFVIDDVAYVVDGAGALRAYDPASDTWTARMPFRGTARKRGVAFAVGGLGFFGTGFTDKGSVATSPRHADLWQYQPAADRWTRKSDLQGDPRSNAIGFALGRFGFVGGGNDFSGGRNGFLGRSFFAGPQFGCWICTRGRSDAKRATSS